MSQKVRGRFAVGVGGGDSDDATVCTEGGVEGAWWGEVIREAMRKRRRCPFVCGC